MNGVLLVDKPSGLTSHDVVRRVRRATGVSRIGHTGTLDPIATGVLPLVVGRATRLAQFLAGREKTYEGEIRFGFETDTYDAAGALIPLLPGGRPYTPGAMVSADVLAQALDSFRGTHWQTPPAYSAKKIGGIRSHVLARRRTPVELLPVEVTVFDLTLRGFTGDRATVVLTCSAGFYVRSFAHDLGRILGCGGHLTALRRVRAGDFTVEEAASLDTLEREGEHAEVRLIPMDRLLSSFPAVIVSERGAKRVAHGNAITAEDFQESLKQVSSDIWPDWRHEVHPSPKTRAVLRLIDAEGNMLGLAEALGDGGVLHPIIVLV